MKYENVWNAVDNLAKKHGLSPSGLAKLAGLDATTFNKSKRIRPDGKKRWPSLDSINKLLEIFNLSFEQFYALSTDLEENEIGSIPFIKLSQCKPSLTEDKAQINTSHWHKISFPDFKESLFAIEIDSDNFAPIYKNSTLLIAAHNSEIRQGDRAIIFFNDENITLKEFVRRTPSKLIVTNINPPFQEEQIAIADITLINRIVWASQ